MNTHNVEADQLVQAYRERVLSQYQAKLERATNDVDRRRLREQIAELRREQDAG